MEVRVACSGLKTAINTSAQYKFERFCQTIMFPSLIVWFGKKSLNNLSWTARTFWITLIQTFLLLLLRLAQVF